MSAPGSNEFQSQIGQEERVPVQISKLTPNTLVASRPVKLIWERSRPPFIRITLETENASFLLGDTLTAVSEKRTSGLFDKYHAKVGPANSATGLFPADNYECGPVKFHWNRSMLIMNTSFKVEDPSLLKNSKVLRVAFKP